MRVFVDADGCPVAKLAARLCAGAGVGCTLVCDTAHSFDLPGVTLLQTDKGRDSADLVIANRVQPGDVVVTQDYGLAALCLARKVRVLQQDGWEYRQENIDGLLTFRAESSRWRAAGNRQKGPAKRKPSQDAAFQKALEEILNSRDKQQEAPA